MKLFFVAGEPSGDKLGSALLEGLGQAAGVPVAVSGIGGPSMAAQGLTSLFPYEELAVMGIAEVLPKYRHLRRRLAETAEAAITSEAQALVTIDSPDFGLRVARRVKAVRPEMRTIHYVAPSVWAWRPGRARRMAKVIDHVLALLPFEPPYMEAAGMTCDFVGHPIVAEPVASDAEAQAFRDKHSIPATEKLVLVLPGSRGSEISRLIPVFGEALNDYPAHLVLPTLPHLRETVAALTRHWSPCPILLDGTDGAEKRAAFGAADAAIAASGTVSLELAAAGTPMVIAYDFNWLTRALVKRVIRVDTVTLVNLVSETRFVPECLAENCRPQSIRAELERILSGGGADQKAAMAETMLRLGAGGEAPGLRAAKSVLAAVKR